MRLRITGIRVECAKRKAHKAIVNYYEENPEQFAKAKEASNKRRETLSVSTATIMIETNPSKLLGKRYYCFNKIHTIGSIKEAEIIIKLKIPVI